MKFNYVAEPFRIKTVEPIEMTTREYREKAVKEANFNMFALDSKDVYIDLLTDSGTGAMSTHQLSAMELGDEAYAGGQSYKRLQETCKEMFGYEFFQVVHQGRAAEKVLLPIFLHEGNYAISNMFFDTTRAHVELAGARAIDCVVEEAKNPSLDAKFKGNMDVKKMREKIEELGAENIGMVVMTITNNSAGGQPVSMANLKEVYEICQEYGIMCIIDAARFAENAYFIQRDEEGYQDKSIAEIVKEMFSYADSFTMSAKKDAIVNMGGLIGIKEEGEERELPLEVMARTVPFEGFISYGGMNGRDIDALAVGLKEGTNEDYLKYRIGQSEYMAARLDEAGIAYQTPAGGHGLFIDAHDMFPHIPYYEFPAQVLCVELYKEAGIRPVSVDSYMLGNDPDTGEQLQADFEFTRLALPRRVYTQAHLDIIVDALIAIKKRAHEIKGGYRITWEPKVLRHFQAHLEEIPEDELKR